MADPDRACLVLETGVNERFRYGRYRRTPESTAEAQAWEEAKRGVKCVFMTHGSFPLILNKEQAAVDCRECSFVPAATSAGACTSWSSRLMRMLRRALASGCYRTRLFHCSELTSGSNCDAVPFQARNRSYCNNDCSDCSPAVPCQGSARSTRSSSCAMTLVFALRGVTSLSGPETLALMTSLPKSIGHDHLGRKHAGRGSPGYVLCALT